MSRNITPSQGLRCLTTPKSKIQPLNWFADPIMSILDLGKVIFQPVDDLVAWMQGKHLLASSKTCPACNTAMHGDKHQS